MLIAIVSDTHHDKESLNKILKCTEKAEVLIHLGDNVEDAEYIKKHFKGETYYVRGNCDPYNSAPSESMLEFNGKKIFAAHGDRYGVKMGPLMLKFRAEELGAHIALYGHTHMPHIEEVEGMWIINPGSPALPRLSKKSIVFMEIEENKNIYPYIYTL